jgi:hypothetical protein
MGNIGTLVVPKSKPKRGPIRRTIRIIVACVLLCVGYCVLHVLLVLAFPQVLFSDRITRENLTVHMRQEIPPEINDVLDRAQSLLSASEIYDADVQYDIFILNSYGLSRYLLLRNTHFGCNMPTGDTFLVNADVKKDLAFCEKISRDDRRLRSLSGVIVHEIVHDLMRQHLGWSAERKTPSWIKEGYCEFIGQASAIDHDLGLSILTSGDRSTPGFPNFKHRLMVEYLLTGRGLTIEEVLRSPPDYASVEAEVLAALRADERGFLDRIDSTIGTADRAKRWR